MQPVSTALPFRRTLRLALIAIGCTLVLGYAIYQARFLLVGPVVTLEGPVPTVTNERVLQLSGVARNITKLTLNGREIHTDARGRFTEALVLENGYTIMTLRAHDRYGRETELARSIVYLPASGVTIR